MTVYDEVSLRMRVVFLETHLTAPVVAIPANDNAIAWRFLRRWRRWLQATHG